jgi:hypothetical protein
MTEPDPVHKMNNQRRRRRLKLSIRLSRLRHPIRWSLLDTLIDVECQAQSNALAWRQRARSAHGKELWFMNYLAALSDQCIGDITLLWAAIYHNDPERQDAARARWDQTMDRMRQVHDELREYQRCA